MRRSRLGSSVLLATLLACGPGAGPAVRTSAADSAAPAPEPADRATAGRTACDLVDAAELTRLTGIALREGELMSDYLGVSQCKWRRLAGTDDGIVITLRERGDMQSYASVPGSTPVRGLGDEAVWNGTTNQLAARRGPAIVSISFFFPDGREDWARAIARSLLARLERK